MKKVEKSGKQRNFQETPKDTINDEEEWTKEDGQMTLEGNEKKDNKIIKIQNTYNHFLSHSANRTEGGEENLFRTFYRQ